MIYAIRAKAGDLEIDGRGTIIAMIAFLVEMIGWETQRPYGSTTNGHRFLNLGSIYSFALLKISEGDDSTEGFGPNNSRQTVPANTPRIEVTAMNHRPAMQRFPYFDGHGQGTFQTIYEIDSTRGSNRYTVSAL